MCDKDSADVVYPSTTTLLDLLINDDIASNKCQVYNPISQQARQRILLREMIMTRKWNNVITTAFELPAVPSFLVEY